MEADKSFNGARRSDLINRLSQVFRLRPKKPKRQSFVWSAVRAARRALFDRYTRSHDKAVPISMLTHERDISIFRVLLSMKPQDAQVLI